MRNLFALTAVLLFLILIAPMPAFTQSGIARISGTIDDASGGGAARRNGHRNE